MLLCLSYHTWWHRFDLIEFGVEYTLELKINEVKIEDIMVFNEFLRVLFICILSPLHDFICLKSLGPSKDDVRMEQNRRIFKPTQPLVSPYGIENNYMILMFL